MAFFGTRTKAPVLERTAPTMPKANYPNIRRISHRKRDFDAASVSEVYSAWTTTALSPDQVVNKSLSILRARSRQLWANNDLAKAFIRLCENNIVGENGFRLRAKSRDASGELDKQANKAIEAAWHWWGEDPYCDFQLKHNMASFDKLVVTTLAVDGEVFIQELPGERFGVSFRLLDPEAVPIDYNVERAPGQNLIRFGIEYDKYDRPVAYYFRDRNGPISFYSGRHLSGANLKRIDAKHIQHVFIQDRIGLRRGFPWMSAGMIRFRMLGKFEDSALQNAIIGASKVAIISGEGSEDIVDGENSEGEPILETDHVGVYQVDGEVNVDTFDTDFPSAEYGPFVTTNTKFLAAGVGVTHHSLSGDLTGINYSSLRHASSEERSNWSVLQKFVIHDWKRPQYRRWLKMALLLGIEFGRKGRLRVQDFHKYSMIEFLGRRWLGVDPLKDAAADNLQMQSNTNSPQRVMLARGLEPDEVLEEIKEFYDRMQESGIPVTVGNQVININTGDDNNAEKN